VLPPKTECGSRRKRDEAMTPRSIVLPMQKSLGPLRGSPRLAPDDGAVEGKPLVGFSRPAHASWPIPDDIPAQRASHAAASAATPWRCGCRSLVAQDHGLRSWVTADCGACCRPHAGHGAEGRAGCEVWLACPGCAVPRLDRRVARTGGTANGHARRLGGTRHGMQ
jgi:hypothetical protein